MPTAAKDAATAATKDTNTKTTNPSKSNTKQHGGFEQAAEIANKAIKFAKQHCQPNSSVRQIISKTHRFIADHDGHQAFPCSVSVNDLLCHGSPCDDEEDVVLRSGDVVKMELGVRVDDCPCLVCTTLIVGGTDGDQSQDGELVGLAEAALKELIGTFKPSTDALVAVQQFHAAFKLPPNYQFIEGMMSHRLDRRQLSTDDILVIKPVEGQNKMVNRRPFKVDDVWAVDVAISNTATGKARTAPFKTAIFAKSGSTAPLRLQASRQGFSRVSGAYGLFAFNQQQFVEAGGVAATRARAALQECVGKGVLVPYDYLQVVPDHGDGADGKVPKAARFLATIQVTESGFKLLTDPFSI